MQFRQKSSKRLCVLLVVLVLCHEFNHVIAADALTEKRRQLDENEERTESRYVNTDIEQTDSHDENVEKRGALFALSMTTSLLNVGLDVFIKLKGCCIFYRSLCRDVKTFRKTKRIVGELVQTNNEIWKKVNALKDWTVKSNELNGAIWLEIIRIEAMQKQIIEMLSPEVLKAFNIEELKLKQAISANNRSVLAMSYKQLSDRLESPFDSVEGTAMLLSGVTGMAGMKIAKSAFKFYKLRKISKILRSSYGAKLAKAGPAAKKILGFSKSSLNKHIQQTSKSMYKAKFSGGKYGKFMKGAGRVMSVATIAMDVYSIVMKIKGCRTRRNQARKAVREIIQAEKESRQMYDDLKKYEKELNIRGVKYITEQLKSSDLHNILDNFRELSESAPTEARDMRSAAPIISQFLSGINNAHRTKVMSFQRLLLGGLKKITVFYLCYLRKLQLVNYVTDGCRKGDSSLKDLYSRGNRLYTPNSSFCKFKNGIPYTKYKDVKDLVTKKAKSDNFNIDCVMNSQEQKRQVCWYKYSGYNAKQAAAKVKELSVGQVELIYKTCPPPPISPKIFTDICFLRSRKLSEEFISKVTRISVERLKTVKC